jgi:hypothetical protein
LDKKLIVEFCKKCGAETRSDKEVCLNCGAIIKDNKSDGITLGILSLFFAVLFPILGFIFSWIGLSHAHSRNSNKGKIINQIALFLSAIATVIYLTII